MSVLCAENMNGGCSKDEHFLLGISWSGGRSPCPGHGGGTITSLRSFPTQALLQYDFMNYQICLTLTNIPSQFCPKAAFPSSAPSQQQPRQGKLLGQALFPGRVGDTLTLLLPQGLNFLPKPEDSAKELLEEIAAGG